MDSLVSDFGGYPLSPQKLRKGSRKPKLPTIKTEVVRRFLGMEVDVTRNDPVWRAHAVSWIMTRIDDLEYMVELG